MIRRNIIYCTDVCFEVFELAEGQTAQCRVPDAEGNIVLCVRMRREKNRTYIESEGENDRVTYLLRNTERIPGARKMSAQLKQRRRAFFSIPQRKMLLLNCNVFSSSFPASFL